MEPKIRHTSRETDMTRLTAIIKALLIRWPAKTEVKKHLIVLPEDYLPLDL